MLRIPGISILVAEAACVIGVFLGMGLVPAFSSKGLQSWTNRTTQS